MKKRNLRKNTNQAGITLIALVVTIVVLLLLASITINLIVSDNGILGKARNSKEKWNEAEVSDQMSAMLADYKVEKITKGTSLLDYLNSKKEAGTLDEVTDNGDGTITVKLGGYEVIIDSTTDTIISSEKAMAKPTVGNVTVSYINSSSQKVTAQNNGTIEQGTALIIEFTSQIEGGTVAVTTNGKGTLVDNNGQVTYTTDGKETEVTFTITGTTGKGKSTKTKNVDLSSYYVPPTLASLKRIPAGKTVTVEDEIGNKIVVTKGFKIAQDSGTTVQQGIVVEDNLGNQYVWVPVSNIDASGSNKIKLDDNSEVEITLGRYTFDAIYQSNSEPTGTGEATLQQKGSEWASETAFSNLDWKVTELKDSRASNGSYGLEGTNTTAKDLQGFIESVRDNHGYYMARYEASKENGTSETRVASIKNKETWTDITQGNAAIVCKNMYTETNDDIECDLMNSYAWDTAIVYIQKCTGDISYSKASSGENTTKVNTGTTGDEKCKINDMAKNVSEWTTEYSSYLFNRAAYCCTYRGGTYNSNRFVSYRLSFVAYNSLDKIGFRPLLYVKTEH